jgi:hypothetical protein
MQKGGCRESCTAKDKASEVVERFHFLHFEPILSVNIFSLDNIIVYFRQTPLFGNPHDRTETYQFHASGLCLSVDGVSST